MRGGLESFLIKKLWVTRRPCWIGLDAHYVGHRAHAGDSSRDIIDLDIHVRGIGRSRLEVCGALVIDAYQVHPGIGRIDRKVTLGVGRRMRDLRMLWSSAISVTVSPAAGVFVVPLVTVPVMVAAEAAGGKQGATRRAQNFCAA